MKWGKSACGYFLISECLIYTVSRARMSRDPEVWRYTAWRLSSDGDKALGYFDAGDAAKLACEEDAKRRAK